MRNGMLAAAMALLGTGCVHETKPAYRFFGVPVLLGPIDRIQDQQAPLQIEMIRHVKLDREDTRLLAESSSPWREIRLTLIKPATSIGYVFLPPFAVAGFVGTSVAIEGDLVELQPEDEP